jgi:hypothetical protein
MPDTGTLHGDVLANGAPSAQAKVMFNSRRQRTKG